MTGTRRLDAACERLEARGYTLGRRDRYAVATPGADADTDRVGVPGELHVAPARTEPAALLEAVGAATSNDRIALFVAHPSDESAAREVLTDPPGLVDQSADRRTFYDCPARLRAGDAGLACCRADDPPVWREVPANGVTGEGTRFVLEADGAPAAAFESFEALSEPPETAFGYAYRRDEDGRFRVRDLAGDRTVGRFVSVRELRANAYQPVPAPLVPERVVDGYLPEAWALATVEDGRVTSVESA